MLKKILHALDERVLFPARINYLVHWLSPQLMDSGNVLDLGASDGRLAHALSQHAPATFTGCDVLVPEKTAIPVVQYDGTTLPFEDRSFDAVMLIDMLHHTDDPVEIVREAVRVSRKYVLIKDHYYNNSFDWYGLKAMDYVGNAPYNIRLPYNYLNDGQWRGLINTLNLRIVHEAKFRYNLIDPCRHVLFKLAVPGADSAP